tara:strand:+ start:46 stop:279 length:234 start_codon:yes stop_codon:yes gene_type:complete
MQISDKQHLNKIFNQVIDEEIEIVTWKINRIPKTNLSSYETVTRWHTEQAVYMKQIKFLKDWKNKVSNKEINYEYKR